MKNELQEKLQTKFLLEDEKGNKIWISSTKKIKKEQFEEYAFEASVYERYSLEEIAYHLVEKYQFQIISDEAIPFFINGNPSSESKLFIKRNYFIKKITNVCNLSWEEVVSILNQNAIANLFVKVRTENQIELKEIIDSYYEVVEQI